MLRITLAGTPPKTTLPENDLHTVAPAAQIVRDPKTEPAKMVTWQPTQQSLLIMMGLKVSGCDFIGSVGLFHVWLKLINELPCAIATSEPIVTPP